MDQIYFEKQGWSLQCGIHCLNNLLAGHHFQKSEIQKICKQLEAQSNLQQQNLCGGDYNIDVLLVALNRKGFQAQWHDNRDNWQFNHSKKTVGYIVNLVEKKNFFFKLLCCWSHRHWVAFRKSETNYVWLDSKLPNPLIIPQQQKAEKYVNTYLQQNCSIIRIYRMDTQSQVQLIKSQN